jgi:DnaJ-class molecular chaperone
MTAIDRVLNHPITVPCPACEGMGEVDDFTVSLSGISFFTKEDCPWCEGDGLVSPEKALEFHRAKEAGRT